MGSDEPSSHFETCFDVQTSDTTSTAATSSIITTESSNHEQQLTTKMTTSPANSQSNSIQVMEQLSLIASTSSSCQDSDLRCEERLKIKIGEAKRLLGPGKGGTGCRDVYVTINLDREEIFRTSLIEKTLNPFFGEEFTFEIPRRFRSLSFYVYDKEINYRSNLNILNMKNKSRRSKSINSVATNQINSSVTSIDKVIGKVTIKREDLNSFNGKDHWFKLNPVTQDTEIGGQILFTIKLIDSLNHTTRATSVADKKLIMIRVLEADDLSLINGHCDPFVVVTLSCLTKCKSKKKSDANGDAKVSVLKKIQTKRTKVKKKTNDPLFDESFYLDVPNCSIIDCINSIKRISNGSTSSGDERLSSASCCLSNLVINLSVYHDGPSNLIGLTDSSKRTTFLGEVNVPLSSILNELLSADGSSGYTCWHLLQPRTAKDNLFNDLKKQKMRDANSISTLSSSDYQSAISTLKDGASTDLGSVRLKINYTSDYVLNSKYYDSLRELILISPFVKPITSSAAFILGEIFASTHKTELAASLVKLFIAHARTDISSKNISSKNILFQEKNISSNNHKLLLQFIKSFAEWEISQVTDVNTIFRGNTLLSKFLDELMRFTGSKYLHETLKDVLIKIIKERKNTEIDINRLANPNEVNDNLNNLLGYLNLIFKSIITSVILCPKIMRESFAVLKELSLKYFPKNREISYSVISGFIFLRFFAPAILNPKLFDIINDSNITIDPIVTRTLTLISKSIQMMGNIVSSKINNLDANEDANLKDAKVDATAKDVVTKEDFMGMLQRTFVTSEYIESTRMFLEMISSPTDVSISSKHFSLDGKKSIILKDGYLMKHFGKNLEKNSLNLRKKSSVFKNIFFKNSKNSEKFRKKYFILSTSTFGYLIKKRSPNSSSCYDLAQYKWLIPIQDIVSVQRLKDLEAKDGTKEMKKDVLIVTINDINDSKLYLKSSNCVDEQEWFNVLSRVVLSNNSSNVSRNVSKEDANDHEEDIQVISSANNYNFNDLINEAIDSDREVSRISSLLLEKESAMNELLENCFNLIQDAKNCEETLTETPSENERLTPNETLPKEKPKLRESRYNTGLIEDPKSFMKTIESLKSSINQLKINEEIFVKKNVIDTIYGSKSTPIGDDHYLKMVKKHNI